MKLASLHEPFDPAKISWRLGAVDKVGHKGLALAYIDARDVMERLDKVCGPENWSDEYTETAKGRVICTIRIKLGDDWVGKTDGAGDTDVEADKGAISDAFKRAAVKWGVGRYLYNLDSAWVRAEQKGRSWVIPKSELPGLQKILRGHTVQDTGSKAIQRDEFDALMKSLRGFTSVDDLDTWYARPETADAVDRMPPDWRYELQVSFLVHGTLISESQTAANEFKKAWKNMWTLLPDESKEAVVAGIEMGNSQAA